MIPEDDSVTRVLLTELIVDRGTVLDWCRPSDNFGGENSAKRDVDGGEIVVKNLVDNLIKDEHTRQVMVLLSKVIVDETLS